MTRNALEDWWNRRARQEAWLFVIDTVQFLVVISCALTLVALLIVIRILLEG